MIDPCFTKYTTMAMFDKHKSSKQTPARTQEPSVAPPAAQAAASAAAGAHKAAMIGQGIEISGDVRADANLRIEGTLDGRIIKGSQDVEIGESGKVNANIEARVVKVGGEVNGDISGSEKVMITRTGRVQGNITAPRVQLEDGALFRGSIEMNPAEPAEARKPAALPSSVSSQEVRPRSADASRKEPGLSLKSG